MNLHGRPTVSGMSPEEQSALGDLSTEPCGLVYQPLPCMTGSLGRPLRPAAFLFIPWSAEDEGESPSWLNWVMENVGLMHRRAEGGGAVG